MIVKPIIIFGAGGFAEEIIMTINAINKIKKSYKILGVIDEDKKMHGKNIEKAKVLGGMDWFSLHVEYHGSPLRFMNDCRW